MTTRRARWHNAPPLRSVVLAVLAFTVAAVGQAGPTSQTDLVIRPGHGIGKFRLGGGSFGLVRVDYQYGPGAHTARCWSDPVGTSE